MQLNKFITVELLTQILSQRLNVKITNQANATEWFINVLQLPGDGAPEPFLMACPADKVMPEKVIRYLTHDGKFDKPPLRGQDFETSQGCTVAQFHDKLLALAGYYEVVVEVNVRRGDAPNYAGSQGLVARTFVQSEEEHKELSRKLLEELSSTITKTLEENAK